MSTATLYYVQYTNTSTAVGVALYCLLPQAAGGSYLPGTRDMLSYCDTGYSTTAVC